MSSVPSWNDFVKGHLINHGVISGIVLLTRFGQQIYSYGELANLKKKEEFTEFISAFRTSCQSDDTTDGKVFQLSLKTDLVHFKVFKQTYCSIYATSDGNQDGLAVCNLPYGIMICTYHLPVKSNQAMKVIESFCEILRA